MSYFFYFYFVLRLSVISQYFTEHLSTFIIFVPVATACQNPPQSHPLPPPPTPDADGRFYGTKINDFIHSFIRSRCVPRRVPPDPARRGRKQRTDGKLRRGKGLAARAQLFDPLAATCVIHRRLLGRADNDPLLEPFRRGRHKTLQPA